MGFSKAFKSLMRKQPETQRSRIPKKKKLSHQDVFVLKLKVLVLLTLHTVGPIDASQHMR